ncbi:hypothetical protein L7F22_001592 [Adiantum nelumboides]|nr:hypothetical protein [Adiantum nelumboides]
MIVFSHPCCTLSGDLYENQASAFQLRTKVKCKARLPNKIATLLAHNQASMEIFPSDLSIETAGIVPQELAEQILPEALAYASLHGILMGDKSVESSGRVPGTGLVHAPISLLPCSFFRRHFKQAVELAPLFNQLVDNISKDYNFLQDSLSRTKKADTFTARLLDIHDLVLQEGIKQVRFQHTAFLVV